MSDKKTTVGPLLVFSRYVVPVLIGVTGVIVMTFGSTADLIGGAFILGAAPAVYALNLYYRVAVHSERDRDEEEAARVFLDEHGYWPDQAPPRAASRDAQHGGAPNAAEPAGVPSDSTRVGAARDLRRAHYGRPPRRGGAHH